MLAAWNHACTAMFTTAGSCMPPSSSGSIAAFIPASANTFRAAATSGTRTTLPSTRCGSFSSAVRLCGAKCSVAICSASSRTASKVSRECSA
jgi:hypothetical protein